MSDGYYDLHLSPKTCEYINYIKSSAEQQSRPLGDCGFQLFCPRFGNYNIAATIELKYRGIADRISTTRSALWIDGSDMGDSVRTQLDCTVPLAVAVPIDEPLNVRIEFAGALQRINLTQVMTYVTQVAQTAGLAVSIFRPSLGGRIVSGNQTVHLGDRSITLNQLYDDLNARAVAMSRLLEAISKETGQTKRSKDFTIGVSDDLVRIVHGGKYLMFEFTKSYRWSVLADKAGKEQQERRFHTNADGFSGLTSNIDPFLKSSIGTDTKTIKDSLDTLLDSWLSSNDADVVLKACQSIAGALTGSLQPHDVLGFIWSVSYIARKGQSGPPCFTEKQRKDLERVGLSRPPYPGAYPATSLTIAGAN